VVSVKLLVDVDGVLADFVSGLCARLKERGFTRTPEDIRSWSLEDSLTAEEVRECMHIMSVPGFCRSLEWYEGAKDFLRLLRGAGDVFAVTAPFDASETWERERKAWLESHIPRKQVLPISGEFKRLVRGDVLIEDHPGTACEWLEDNPSGVAILIDRPWNGPKAKEWNMHRRMYRASSYSAALNIIWELA
jgi:5'(3')-deoxyribonucleotidase